MVRSCGKGRFRLWGRRRGGASPIVLASGTGCLLLWRESESSLERDSILQLSFRSRIKQVNEKAIVVLACGSDMGEARLKQHP
jgi:hypothetical protein